MKIILYLVVLVSGLSILFRKESTNSSPIKYNNILLIIIGFGTGLICSITGAGGPIIVLPILILIGIEVHEAVAIALFNSIFIGIPAAFGYIINSNLEIIKPILPIALFSHGIGVFIGSKNGNKINQKVLKKSVAVFSIIVAIAKLLGM